MFSAARFLLFGLAVAVVAASPRLLAQPVSRGTPTRPIAATAAAPAVARVPQGKLISVAEVAARFGLKQVTALGQRKLVFADPVRRLEVEFDSRECMINGLRFFLGEPVIDRRGVLCISETDYETCLVPLLRPTVIGQAVPRSKIAVLDPGHGGVDNGTQNPKSGLKEKVFTLDVALRLKKLLENRGYTVVLTRESDQKVELAERAVIANRAKADLFVSIHFNSLYPDMKTTGAEVFTFTRAGQRSDQSRGFGQENDTENDPAPVNRYDPWSVALGQALHREIISALKLPDRGHKTKHLGMMRGLNCPAVLVEAGFLSNNDEARKIETARYRQAIAEALASGIENYSILLDGLRQNQKSR